MIENLKNKLALYFLRKSYKRAKADKKIEYDFFRKSSKYLIVMPDSDEDYQNSFHIIRYLAKKKKNVSVFIPEYKMNLFDKSLKCEIITYGLSDKTKLNLPSKEIIEKLKEKKYDAILDLNKSENLYFAGVALLPECKIRAGVNKQKTKQFYNVLFNISENNSEISYRNLLNSLSMF
ncbi:MAG: hypothetical protein GXX85_02820 [Ignavibacteria bacterium]|nr:hypothetical protein [Ignavibacteria bacterium]